MTTISWTVAASGAWIHAANWSPATVPGTGDVAVIGAAGSYLVTVAGATVDSVVLSDASATLLSGGTLTVNSGLAIDGTLDIVSGTVIALGTLTNGGTILASGALELFGGYDAASLERIGGSGGALALAGSLANVGGTLDGSGLSQLTLLSFGTIQGGVVAGIARPGGGTLDGVTWRGPLDVNASPIGVRNGLVVTGGSGSGPGAITINGGSLLFIGSQTLDNASLSGRGAIVTDSTLDFAAGLSITVADFGVLNILGSDLASGEIGNAGTIAVVGQPRFPGDQGVAASIDVAEFDNSGTVETGGAGGIGSDAFITIAVGTFANHAGAVLGAFGGRVQFDPASVVTNDGTIAAAAGEMDIGGILQGTGDVAVAAGGIAVFAGAVAATQHVEMSGKATVTLDQPVFFAGTIDGFAPGEAIDIGTTATPTGFAADTLTLVAGGSRTLDLHIAGPFGLANFSVSPSGAIQVNGTSAASPIVSVLGQGGTYSAGGAAITVGAGLTIGDHESPTLVGAGVTISGGALAGDILSADTTGTAITASFNAATDALTLGGTDMLADYQRVLRSVAYSSGSVDPTKATRQPNRTITWVVNDGSTSSAPVTSGISVLPPPRSLTWTGAQGSALGNAANWSDATNALNPALLAPDVADTVTFSAGGGAVAGVATVAALSFGGGNVWHIASGGTLTSVGIADVGDGAFGMLAISAGGTLAAGGLDVAATSDGVVAVEGAGSGVNVGGQLTIGDAASAELSVLGGGSVTAGDMDIGLGKTATGNVDLEGAGSRLDISGGLNLGDAGIGVLTLGNGTTAHVAGSLNVGANGVLNQFGGVIDPSVVNNTGRAGGKGSISASVSIANSGTVFAASGTEMLSTPIITGTGALEIDSKGDLVVNVGSVMGSQTVGFTDATGVLTIGTLGGFAAVIGDVIAGDSIVVQGTSIASLSFDASTHALALFDAAHVQAGVLLFGTSVVDQSLISVNGLTPCFVVGTRIGTERGEVCVEKLRVGDLVCTIGTAPSPQPPPARGGGVPVPVKDPPSPCGRGLGGGGRARPVIWLGHRTVDCARHPQPHKVWPVCVAAYAFGANQPARDLWLSPDHALYVGDVLIPVKYLLNETTIVQVPCDRVTYYHVELPRHSVLLAEGLAAESYLDTGDRASFANCGGPIALHPDFASRQWEATGCASLVVTGPALDAARRRLRGRAA